MHQVLFVISLLFTCIFGGVVFYGYEPKNGAKEFLFFLWTATIVAKFIGW